MFYLFYVLSELRRRRGRTILTAVGLAVGVALVVTVNALSTGLDNAQAQVLSPLTGVGTDMSVTRPLKLSTTGGNPFANLTPAERQQLLRENGGQRLGFRNIAKPGQKFNVDRFTTAGQLSFPASEVKTISFMPGVQQVAGSLTLTDTHISGTLPKNLPSQNGGIQRGGGFGPGSGGGTAGPGGGGGFFGPTGISFDSRTVTGVDQSTPALGAVTPGQITSGHYFGTGSAATYQAILSTAYAKRMNLSVGSSITVDGKSFHVVGLASQPLGGTSSDIYVPLTTLQNIAGFKNRVNMLEVRATTASAVSSVQHEITTGFSGAQVTTAQDLASRITGSLTDAKNLASKLGLVLEIVGLLAAVLIAILLTLSSVTKRIREIGTLKAIGWSQSLVVRQISLEALLQGLFGGLIGAVLGIAGAAVIGALGVTLQASVASAAQPTTPFGFGRFAQQSAAAAGSTIVKISAPVDLLLIVAAVGLAAAGGLLAGAIGGLRAARLRPADALRTVE